MKTGIFKILLNKGKINYSCGLQSQLLNNVIFFRRCGCSASIFAAVWFTTNGVLGSKIKSVCV
jgi:hypothetical protein